MSEWIYPDVIKKLRFSCVAFLEENYLWLKFNQK